MMATRIVWIVLQDPVELVVTRPWFLFSSLEKRERLSEDWETDLGDRLRGLAERTDDLRVYVVAGENLHFAYEMPELEDEEMRGALGLRLRKDLLFPLRDFFFAFRTRKTDGGAIAEVAGARRAGLAPVFRATNRAELAVQRVFMRDHFLEKALLGPGSVEEPARPRLLADDGLLLQRPDAPRQRLNRLPALPGDDMTRRLRQVRRLFDDDGEKVEEILASPELVAAAGEDGPPRLAPLPETLRRPWETAFARPDRFAASLPWHALQEEEPVGFRPERRHLAALAVVLFLAWQFWSVRSEERAIADARAAIASDADRVGRARKTVAMAEKQGKELDELDKAFGLMQNEGYQNLAMLELLSACRPEAMRFGRIRFDGGSVALGASTRTKQEAFDFVAALQKDPRIASVRIRSMNFDESGQVRLEVDATRSG